MESLFSSSASSVSTQFSAKSEGSAGTREGGRLGTLENRCQPFHDQARHAVEHGSTFFRAAAVGELRRNSLETAV